MYRIPASVLLPGLLAAISLTLLWCATFAVLGDVLIAPLIVGVVAVTAVALLGSRRGGRRC
jgi:hypothetical protein